MSRCLNWNFRGKYCNSGLDHEYHIECDACHKEIGVEDSYECTGCGATWHENCFKPCDVYCPNHPDYEPFQEFLERTRAYA